MDAAAFDALARRAARLHSPSWPSLSRRAALRHAAGGSLAALGLAADRPRRSAAAQAALPSWVQVGTPAQALYSGPYGLFATSPATGNLWQYLGQPFVWQEIGTPGSQFAVTADAVYGLSPDRSGVYRYDGTPFTWTQVGGPAEQLYGGGYGLFATEPGSGDLWRYLGQPLQWQEVGGPGSQFAVTAEGVYGLTPDRQAVYRYDGAGIVWTQVGGPAEQLYGGGYGLVATSPATGNLWQYLGQPLQWQEIGGPGSQFAVTADALYGLSPDRSGVYRYDGTPLVWTQVGTAAEVIVPGGPFDRLYALSPQTRDVWALPYGAAVPPPPPQTTTTQLPQTTTTQPPLPTVCNLPLQRGIATQGGGTAGTKQCAVATGCQQTFQVNLQGAAANTAFDVYIDQESRGDAGHIFAGTFATDAAGNAFFQNTIVVPGACPRVVDNELVLQGADVVEHQYIQESFAPCASC